jgi:hypothetical protein
MSFTHDFELFKYALGEMNIWVMVNWAVLLLISAAIIYFLRIQNRYYLALVNESPFHTEEKTALFTLAKMRGRVILLLWIALMVIIIFLDIKQQIDRSQNYLSAQDNSKIDDEHVNPYEAEEKTELSSNNKLSPLKIEKIKSSYEDAFVSYFILEKCNAAELQQKSALYNALLGSLGDYEHKIDAANIVIMAAQGTYNSLYENVECDVAAVETTKKNLKLFMSQVKAK